MTRSASRDLMRQERREIKALLGTLTPAQWRAATLCGDWTVAELVAHLIAWDDLLLYRSRRGHAGALLWFAWLYGSSLGSMTRLNARLQRRVRDREPSRLLARFGVDDDAALKWLFDGSNPGAHLAEYVVHRQDICRPLGLEAASSAETITAALRGVTKLPGVRVNALRQLRHRRFEATDLEWSRGRGVVTRLPAAEILIVLSGRTSIV